MSKYREQRRKFQRGISWLFPRRIPISTDIETQRNQEPELARDVARRIKRMYKPRWRKMQRHRRRTEKDEEHLLDDVRNQRPTIAISKALKVRATLPVSSSPATNLKITKLIVLRNLPNFT
ncbi:unnamed protein product [Xylocopa violacea]|uniref:Uncharacterized protein n=1 Tax=Xylocopa violacea TaxID=135666 RepID=A0ABP1PDT8_XYLVO